MSFRSWKGYSEGKNIWEEMCKTFREAEEKYWNFKYQRIESDFGGIDGHNGEPLRNHCSGGDLLLFMIIIPINYCDSYSDKSVESVSDTAVRELEDLLRSSCRFLEKRS